MRRLRGFARVARVSFLCAALALGFEAAFAGSAAERRDTAVAVERARSLRRLGTIEGRREAIGILSVLHRRDPADVVVARELARTYVEARFPSHAVETLERCIARRSALAAGEDPETRVEVARLLLRRTTQKHDTLDVPRAIVHLDAALAACSTSSGRGGGDWEWSRSTRDGAPSPWPACSQAMRLRSVAFVLLRPGARHPLAYSRAGLRLTERMIASDPQDPDVLLLHGIHLYDLDDIEAAEEAFRRAVAVMPSGDAAAFLIAPAIDDSSLDQASPEQKDERIAAYWDRVDPTPLTLRNELLVAYWYRAALADLYFSEPERGLRGWATDPGRTMMLLGNPLERTDEGWSFGSDASIGADPGRGPRNPTGRATILFEPQNLTFTFSTGTSFTFLKRHPDHPWKASGSTAAALQAAAPGGNPRLTFTGTDPIDRIHAAVASFRDPRGASRATCFVAIPPWSGRAEWWSDAVVDVRLLDRQARVVGQEQRMVSSADIVELDPGVNVLVVGRDFHDVEPGMYTMAVDIRDRHLSRSGSLRERIEVRDLGGTLRSDGGVGEETRVAVSKPRMGPRSPGQGRLRMSQMELFRAGTARWNDTVFRRPERPYLPDPMAILGPSDEVEAYYELYDLTDRDGSLCYRVTQTVVPIAYRRAWEGLHRQKIVDRADSLAYGREGDRLGKVALNESNRRSVAFPPTRIPARSAAVDGEGRSVVRATARIAAAGLAPGGYAFRIEVEDCSTGSRASAETYFEVVPSAELARMRGAPRR